MSGQTSGRHFYYRSSCEHKVSIRGEILEPSVLEFLYQSFLDKPAYTKAIKAAIPDDKDRKNLKEDIEKLKKRAGTIQRQLDKLADSIEEGKATKTTNRRIEEREAEQEVVENRLTTLQTELEILPDPDKVIKQAAEIREKLFDEYYGRDWRKLPVDEIREFLELHFGPPSKKNPFGVFVTLIDDDEDCRGYSVAIDEQAWELEFKGRFDDKKLLQEHFERSVDDRLSGSSCNLSPHSKTLGRMGRLLVVQSAEQTRRLRAR